MRRDTDEKGFTVIELVIAMLIMILITTPLMTSFVLGVRATREANQDVQNSVDAQLLASYFDIDVAGSDVVTSDAGASCAVPSGGALAVTLTSSDPGAPKILTYATE